LHAYWHFKDNLFTPDGVVLPTPEPVDAVTQLKIMIAALPAASGASDDVRSYDLTWILHLVGEPPARRLTPATRTASRRSPPIQPRLKS
jgi:hypothetical protein